MKQNKFLIALALLIVAGALYRIIPGRPLGFAPQIAMAIFGGAALKNKKLAFALPLFSMLISDALYQALYMAGLSDMQGFYPGQGENYLLFAGLSFIGIAMRRINIPNIAVASVAAPVLYFLASNFVTWAGHGGYKLPMTGEGLYQTYIYGLPFLKGSLAATLAFNTLLFGAWYALKGTQATGTTTQQAVA
jgi:hypothetical protein